MLDIRMPHLAGVHFAPDLVDRFNEVLPDILRRREDYADED